MLLTHVDIPHYGFLVQTPAQLRFGRERVMVFLETKMSLNSNTVTASVGTWKKKVIDSIWKKCTSLETI